MEIILYVLVVFVLRAYTSAAVMQVTLYDALARLVWLPQVCHQTLFITFQQAALEEGKQEVEVLLLIIIMSHFPGCTE